MGYKIRVNGDVVWESEGSERLINEIAVNTPRGEAARVRVPPEEQTLDLVVDYRSLINQPLDLVDTMNRRLEAPMIQALADEFGGPDIRAGNTTTPGQGTWVDSDPERVRQGEATATRRREETAQDSGSVATLTDDDLNMDEPSEEPINEQTPDPNEENTDL